MKGEGRKSETVRVPNHIKKRAESIAEKKGIPRTRAFEILFKQSNKDNFTQAVRRAEQEILQNLILDYEEEDIKRTVSALNLGAVMRTILDSDTAEERKRRWELLQEKTAEFINEAKEER